MSISPIVDADYRLYVADLEGSARRVVIANVTYQGVEEMTPVLHFVGQTKRLVLSPEQVQQMFEITGTILYPGWIGAAVILQPPNAREEPHIHIKAATAMQRAQPMPVYVSEERRGWALALSVVGLLLSVSAIFAALNLDTILLALQQFRDNWPLR
jgi:hypothetical protein